MDKRFSLAQSLKSIDDSRVKRTTTCTVNCYALMTHFLPLLNLLFT